MQSRGCCSVFIGALYIKLYPLQVNEFLQVEGQHNVFAIGDANNVKETKLGYLATVQVHRALC